MHIYIAQCYFICNAENMTKNNKFAILNTCVVSGPSQWFFHLDEEIVIAWTHIRWACWMFQISHCQECKWSMTTAAVWPLALSWRMIVFSATKCRSFLLSPHALQGTWYNTRDELILVIEQSIWNINKDGCIDGVRHLPNIWQKVINKGRDYIEVHKCCTPVNKAMTEILNCCHYFLSNPCIIANLLPQK